VPARLVFHLAAREKAAVATTLQWQHAIHAESESFWSQHDQLVSAHASEHIAHCGDRAMTTLFIRLPRQRSAYVAY